MSNKIKDLANQKTLPLKLDALNALKGIKWTLECSGRL